MCNPRFILEVIETGFVLTFSMVDHLVKQETESGA